MKTTITLADGLSISIIFGVHPRDPVELSSTHDVDGPSAIIAATTMTLSDAGIGASLHLGDGSLWCCNRLCISCGVKRGKSVTEESLVVLG